MNTPDKRREPGWDDVTATPTPFQMQVGHSRVAHDVLGWCAACDGKTLVDEIVEWRNRAGGCDGG